MSDFKIDPDGLVDCISNFVIADQVSKHRGNGTRGGRFFALERGDLTD